MIGILVRWTCGQVDEYGVKQLGGWTGGWSRDWVVENWKVSGQLGDRRMDG